MNKKELIKPLDKYKIEYEITDNTKEVDDAINQIDALQPVEPPKKVVAQIKVDIDELMEQIKEECEITEKPVCEDAISKHDLWRIIEDNAYWVTYNETSKEKGMTLTGINQALNECPPVEPKIYGNEHNCIMTLFGECSYSETGCGDCAVVEKVRDALKGECPPVEPKTTETMMVDGEPTEIDPLSYEVGYTHGQTDRPKGEWIESYFNECCGTDENHNPVFRKTPCVKCDQCGKKRRDEEKFCPNCGADMRGKEI